MPICAFWMPSRRARLVSTDLRVNIGVALEVLADEGKGDSALKNSLMSAIHSGFLRMTGVSVANSSVIGLNAMMIRTFVVALVDHLAARQRPPGAR